MSKERRSQHTCDRCGKHTDDDSELCERCEVDVLTEVGQVEEIPHGLGGFHGGMSLEALRATHGPAWSAENAWVYKEVSGTQFTPTRYDDPLDQARADSLEGGE